MSRFSSSRVLASALLAQQRGGDADAGERRAQLVAAVGEQQAVGGDQLLDALGRAVEARGQRRHLVAALDLHARAEIAASRAARRRPSAARAGGRAGAPPDRRRRAMASASSTRPPTTQRIGLGRSRTWRATSQRPSGSCRVKVGPPGPRRQPVRARRGSKRGGGWPAMAIMRAVAADRARGRSAACGAARRAPSGPRPAARRRRAAARRSARRRCRDIAASRSSASFHVSAAAPTNTASTSRTVT